MRRTRSTLSSLVFACLPLLALAPACGGALSSSPDGKGDAGGGGSGAGSGDGSGSGGSGGGSSGSGASMDSGSGGSDAGLAPVDAVAVLDGTGPADVTAVDEPPPSGPAVLCPSNGSTDTCAPGQFCCVVGDAKQGGTQTDTCEPAGASCAGTPVECASPADCPGGQICCGTEQTVGNVVSYVSVVCAASCAGTNQRMFCNQQSNTCPVASPTCALSTLMPGYNVCQ
jgi:hypothetical protein